MLVLSIRKLDVLLPASKEDSHALLALQKLESAYARGKMMLSAVLSEAESSHNPHTGGRWAQI
jgi:hypothetical protein